MDRSAWLRPFSTLGYDEEKVMSMGDTEFQNTMDFLIYVGETPDKEPKEITEEDILRRIKQEKPKTRPVPVRNEISQQHRDIVDAQRGLINEQNEEYRALLEKVKEEESQEAYHLPPEPEYGLVVAVMLPSGRRQIRKFEKEGDSIHIYKWVETLVPGVNFRLKTAAGVVLNKDQTNEDNKIDNRTLFCVETMF